MVGSTCDIFVHLTVDGIVWDGRVTISMTVLEIIIFILYDQSLIKWSSGYGFADERINFVFDK